MVAGLFRRLIILLAVSSVPTIQADKGQISNYDDHQNELETKSRAMADLIGKCHSSSEKPLCIGEKLDDDLVTHLYEAMLTTIVSVSSSKLIDRRTLASMKGDGQNDFARVWKAGAFLLPASSPVDLKNQLDFVKATLWWNSVGLFVFSEADDAVGERCSNAYDFLSLAWQNGMLSSVFMCQELDGSLTIYSYNPYGNTAPQPWLMVRETKGENGHPWNLFKWTNYEGRSQDSSCATIFFDKTESLAGYPISTNAVPTVPSLYFNNSEIGIKKYKGPDGWVMREMLTYLNATIVEEPLPNGDAVLGWLDENGTYRGHLKDIASGKVEIGMNRLILRPTSKLTSTYPYSMSKYCFVTKDRGSIPWLLGLVLIFDRWTIGCAVLAFLASTMIFGYFNGRGYFAGFLNTLRIFISSSLVRTPGSTGLRLLLCFVFLFPIVSYSTIQGKILSLIHDPMRFENIESFEELLVSGYKLEGPEKLKDFLSYKGISDSFVVNDLDGCLKKLYNDELVACLSACHSLVVRASHDEKLYIAQEKSDSYPTHYVAKPDWPLVDRLSALLDRLNEAGLSGYFAQSSMVETMSASSLLSDNSDGGAPVQIILKDFRYVFMGIAFGWAFAIVAFIGELVIHRFEMLKIFRIRG